jgi:hypothetical protein
LKVKFIYITAILLTRVLLSWSQESFTNQTDTVTLLKGSVITIGKVKYVAIKDSIFIIPHGTDYKIRPSRESQTDSFFDSLELHTSQRKWMDKLHNIVVTTPKKESISDTIQTSQSIQPYIGYGGKTIRNIKIQRLDPFGPTILDTTRKARSKLETTGNKLHIDTREKIISNYLIFSVGDRIDPSIISDNERIIRKLPFIEDARILITDVPENPDFVDILVLVKDAFSIGAGGEISKLDAGSAKLFENNLGGIGHELHINFYWDGSKDPCYGKELFYIMHNLGGTFIDSRIAYLKVFEKESFNFRLDRPFFTPSVKYAGGFQFEHTSKISKIDMIDSVIATRINYNLTDLWAGRSIALTSVRKYSVDRINFVVASRIQKVHFFKRPEVTDNTFYEFHNKTLWLSSISITSQFFFRSNLIYSFGRTEDIPHGYLLNFTFGPEFGEFTTRFYMSMCLSWGGLLRNVGYLYTRGELGGFSNPIKSPDQGIIHFQSNYFTNLLIVNRFKLRQFVNIDYLKGIQRFSDEFIDIEDNSGIHGYRNDLAKGTQRAIANYEVVAFSPYYFYGFRFVFFGFADFGLISFSQPLFESKLHSGIGLGIRIKNERLTFETIQLRIAYYPSIPGFMSPFGIQLSGEERLNPQDFYAEKPSIIEFN